MAAPRIATLGCTAVRKISAPSWSKSSIINLNFGMGHCGGGNGGGDGGGGTGIGGGMINLIAVAYQNPDQ